MTDRPPEEVAEVEEDEGEVPEQINPEMLWPKIKGIPIRLHKSGIRDKISQKSESTRWANGRKSTGLSSILEPVEESKVKPSLNSNKVKRSPNSQKTF